ncbi:MAG: hypothetical protein ACM3ZT_00005 [Bacillota bacterium]
MFLTESQIIDKFARDVVKRAGQVYFKEPAARSFVASCQVNDLAIVGIEGFTLTESATQPHLDMIADYSKFAAVRWEDYRDSLNEAATRFIVEVQKPGIWFNFTVLTRKDWVSS